MKNHVFKWNDTTLTISPLGVICGFETKDGRVANVTRGRTKLGPLPKSKDCGGQSEDFWKPLYAIGPMTQNKKPATYSIDSPTRFEIGAVHVSGAVSISHVSIQGAFHLTMRRWISFLPIPKGDCSHPGGDDASCPCNWPWCMPNPNLDFRQGPRLVSYGLKIPQR